MYLLYQPLDLPRRSSLASSSSMPQLIITKKDREFINSAPVTTAFDDSRAHQDFLKPKLRVGLSLASVHDLTTPAHLRNSPANAVLSKSKSTSSVAHMGPKNIVSEEGDDTHIISLENDFTPKSIRALDEAAFAIRNEAPSDFEIKPKLSARLSLTPLSFTPPSAGNFLALDTGSTPIMTEPWSPQPTPSDSPKVEFQFKNLMRLGVSSGSQRDSGSSCVSTNSFLSTSVVEGSRVGSSMGLKLDFGSLDLAAIVNDVEKRAEDKSPVDEPDFMLEFIDTGVVKIDDSLHINEEGMKDKANDGSPSVKAMKVRRALFAFILDHVTKPTLSPCVLLIGGLIRATRARQRCKRYC
jgi:hypothetical protein